MNRINLLLAFLTMTVVGLQTSCSNSAASINPGGLTIKGELQNADNLSFYFDRINLDNTNFMFPKTEMDGSGKFSLTLEDKIEPGIYRLRVGAKKVYLVLDGSESTIEIKGDLNNFDKYDFEIKGANASSNYVSQMKGFYNQSIPREQMESYIKNEKNSLAAAFMAMSMFGNSRDKLDLFKSVNAKVKKQFPDSKYATDFNNIVLEQEKKIAMFKATEAIQVGKPAPEIKLESPDGKEMALSDLKGKIVLLDFWASWCGPCRKANPHVVETYHKYKDQGFTVYSVSLDGINPRLMNRFKTQDEVDAQLAGAKKRWIDAIAKDQLAWDYHVSDLKYWNSIAAKTYGVRSIPQTFLIDREGNIAALNPRFTLEQELKKLL